MSIPLLTWLRARPTFAWLWAAGFISTVGDAFRMTAVSLWLFEVSGGSGPVMALAPAVGVLPTLLLGALAGVWADRWERRRTLLACDLLRLLCSLGLVAAAALHSLPLGLGALMALSGVSVLGEVAAETTLPRVVGAADLERANGLWVVMAQLSFIVAPLAAAWMYSAQGAAWAFGIDALSFGLSALLLLRLPPLPAPKTHTEQSTAAPIWQDLTTGLKLIGKDRLILSSLLALSLRVCSAGINSVAVIFFIQKC